MLGLPSSIHAKHSLRTRKYLVALLLAKLFLAHYNSQPRQAGLSQIQDDCIVSLEQTELAANMHFAFCIFLAVKADLREDEEDVYFMGARMLIYQLLHDPETRSKANIPFIVLVTAAIEMKKREQLELDGATVIQVPSLKFNWIKPGRPRREHVLDKLHVFTFTK